MFRKKNPVDPPTLARLQEMVLTQRERFRAGAPASPSEGDTPPADRKRGELQRLLRWPKNI